MAGKWHLGTGATSPVSRGFDMFFETRAGNRWNGRQGGKLFDGPESFVPSHMSMMRQVAIVGTGLSRYTFAGVLPPTELI
jgi:hypothetical protein